MTENTSTVRTSRDETTARDRVTGEDRLLIEKNVADLRRRLLDLTLRNRLLKYNPDDAKKDHIRIADEVPTQLIKKLQAGGSLTFEAVPDPETEPEDEKTAEFRAALAKYKETDADWQEAAQKFGPKPKKKVVQQAERKVRDALRKRIGMSPWRIQASAKIHAQSLGIPTTYDLPRESTKSAHDDDKLQTLFFADQMEAKLEHIHSTTSTLEKDAGIQSLYAGFGFLEWQPSKDSTEIIYSPLLLWPLAINRVLNQDKDRYVYSVKNQDDDEAVNESLYEKLREDFSIELPRLEDFSDEEKGSFDLYGWFDAIEKAVKKTDQNWKVHNWIVIGTMTFHRIVLWNDLDPNKWPDTGHMLTHPAMKELFCGTGDDWGEGSGVDYDIDQIEETADQPLLITNADSSQHSAVIDAMTGQNMVIQGPPGTGKSQTITNIIAAALHAGKTVLFVAEKIAALEVVKSRLDANGLGHFCLELHSDKSNRSSVVKSIKSRIEMDVPRHDAAALDSAKRGMQTAKNRLTQYVNQMNAIAGDTGMTVHDIFWGHARTKDQLKDLPSELKKMRIYEPLKAGKFQRQELQRLARQLEDATTVFSELRKPSMQPWRGIGVTNISSFDADDVALEFQKIAAAISAYEETVTSVKAALGWDSDFSTPEDLAKRLFEGIELAPAEPDSDIAGFIRGLRNPDARTDAEQLANTLEVLQEALDTIEATQVPTIGSISPERLKAIVAAAIHADIYNASVEEIEKQCAEFGKSIEAQASAVAALEKLSSILPVSKLKNPPALAAFISAIETEFPAPDIRHLIHQDLGRESTIAHLKILQVLVTDLLAAEKILGPTADITAIGSLGTVRNASYLLRTASFFQKFGSDWRDAKALGAKIDPTMAKAKPLHIAQKLQDAAEWREAKTAYDDYMAANPILGKFISGYTAPIGDILTIAKWMKEVRRAIPIDVEGEDQIFQAIIRADDSGFDALEKLRKAYSPTLAVLATENADTIEGGLKLRQERLQAWQSIIHDLKELGWTLGRKISELEDVAEAIESLELARDDVQKHSLGQRAIGGLWTGDRTSPTNIRRAAEQAKNISAWTMPKSVIDAVFASTDPAAEIRRILALIHGIKVVGERAASLVTEISHRMLLSLADWGEAKIPNEINFARFRARAEVAAAHPDLLPRQCALLVNEQEALNSPLGTVVRAWQKADLSYDGLPGLVDAIWYRSAAEELHSGNAAFNAHIGKNHESQRRQFQELDLKVLELNRNYLAKTLYGRHVPAGNKRGSRFSWTENALLEHQCSLEKPSLHLRRLFSQAPNAIKAYKPCFMMSPMSVARYLAPGRHSFDILVIDEASQLRPQDSVGAVLRAKQTIVVGDNQQLPPSSFFDRQASQIGLDNEESDIVEESVLELGMRAWRRQRKLNWHYRSRHQSLIHFSNGEFYDSKLVVFPSDKEQGPNTGVELVEVMGAYADSINESEAYAITDRALAFMREHPNRSLGIVAVNVPQTELIKKLILEATKTDPAAQAYQEYWSREIEVFTAKSLEAVQGDERDVIYISTVYGKSPEGAFHQHFGPINSAAGHRRLNVLFTRAKHQMVVFTSMDPDWIKTTAQSHRGVKVLKGFLSYAKTGVVPTPINANPDAVPESMFEQWFVERLTKDGFEVVPQVGVKGYRIDIGVRHPDRPGCFILGIECDGATYHSAKSARDRDRLRQSILEDLGWKIYRIWSTDWFRNPEDEYQALLRRIAELRREEKHQILMTTQ